MSNVIVDQDSTSGRLNSVTINQKGKKIRADYYYVEDGLTIQITGRKDLAPSAADLLRMIDAKYSQRIETIYSKESLEFNNNTLPAATDHIGIWFPAANKSFRLLGGYITIGAGLVTQALMTRLYLTDGPLSYDVAKNKALMAWTLAEAAAALTTTQPFTLPFSFPQNGYLSLAKGNVLWCTINQTITTGDIVIITWGIEE